MYRTDRVQQNSVARIRLRDCMRRLILTSERIRFYRAMLCIRGTSHGPVSVSVSELLV